MNTKTIYVAGPMSDCENFNFPAFFAAEAKLRKEGWDVINPARHDILTGDVTVGGALHFGLPADQVPTGKVATTASFNLTTTLLWDLERVAEADAIYLLDGWGDSKGAVAEHALALALGKQVIRQPENTQKVIGLGGSLAAGKDAIADYLVEKHGFIKLGMSDPLHKAMLALDPLVGIGVRMVEEANSRLGFSRIKDTREVRYSDIIAERGYVEAKKEPEVRGLLQRIGTEVGRKIIGENVWVDIAVRNINALAARGKSVVITGVRYPNEVEMFNRVIGVDVQTAWVSRPATERVLDSPAQHTSENSISAADFDVHIINDSTLEALYATARSAFKLEEQV